MVKQKNKKPNNLKKLLAELRSDEPIPAKAKIEDTLTEQQKTRLKPLAWLIAREKYTVDEVLRCMLAYEESSVKKAEDILDLIRTRNEKHSATATV